MTKAPALFIGHGSPMNAIEDTPSSRGWAEIAARFAKPRAIVVVSAHWVTEGVRVMSNAHPRTIHDFGRSFPQALFDQEYPAPGDPNLAHTIVEMLTPFGAELDDTWGLDHGTWSVLKHMYPDADVPVVQVSLDVRRPPAEHYAIGQKLSELRDGDILLLGSGNIVHNLGHWREESVQPWVEDFDGFITDCITQRDDETVIEYLNNPVSQIAAPDWEHFAPLIYVLGASAAEKAETFNRLYVPGISMTSIAFGLTA